MVTRVTVLGATGSIGRSTFDLLRQSGKEFTVAAVAAKSETAKLAAIAREFKAKLAVVADTDRFRELKDALAGTGIEAAAGRSGLLAAAAAEADVVIAGIMGAAGLEPTLAALQRGRRIALANKECLVCAGDLFMRRVQETGAVLLPVDSEHNAVFQALSAGPRDAVEQVTLTASGGPFRTLPRERLAHVTPEDALRHPTWSMGAKISVDSATLMNKGLELIEAHHLFSLPAAQLDVLVHPQSIVHALVTYRDGAVVAGLSVPDMRVPIAHCLGWPKRLLSGVPRLDLAELGSLTFEKPDTQHFPALRLARAALEAGGAMPTVLNAANEFAVDAFLARRLPFTGISALVERVMERAASERVGAPETVNAAGAIDHITKIRASDLLLEFAAKAS